MTVAFNKFNAFAHDVTHGVHNLDTDTLKVMLSNTLPVATNAVKTDITEISAGNGYAAGGAAVTGQSNSQTGGTDTLTGTGPVFTATGAVGPFRYSVLFNDTSVGKSLIGWWDYGSSVTLSSGETFTVVFASGILTLA